MVLLKMVLTSGLYPQIAIADEHNSFKNDSEQAFHTKVHLHFNLYIIEDILFICYLYILERTCDFYSYIAMSVPNLHTILYFRTRDLY